MSDKIHLLLLASIVLVGGCSGRDRPGKAAGGAGTGTGTATGTASAVGGGRTKAGEAPIEVTRLHDEYLANEVAANDRYTGKRIEVGGVITSVGEAKAGPVVCLSDWFHAGREPIPCVLERRQRAAAAKLATDRYAVLSVECKGRVGGRLLLTTGRIVKVAEKSHSSSLDLRILGDPPAKKSDPKAP